MSSMPEDDGGRGSRRSCAGCGAPLASEPRVESSVESSGGEKLFCDWCDVYGGAGPPTETAAVTRGPTGAPTSSQPGEPAPTSPAAGAPRMVAHYVIERELGSGGAGTVYKALDTRLSRFVALKLLRSTETKSRARFEREAKAVARLRHPGIVTVHETGEHEEQPYIVFDLIEGEGLESLLERARLEPRRVAEIVRDIARALAFAHGLGVIHRDVKPENILEDRAGRAYLTDFGLALLLENDRSIAPSLTTPGIFLGTPCYMAPEQATGTLTEHGPRTDVYGLGGVLYRALCGRPPIEGKNLLAILKRIRDAPTPPRELVPDLPPELEAIVLRCLAREPAARYAHAGEVADALDEFLESRNRRARPVLRLAALALVLLLGGAVALLFHARSLAARRSQAVLNLELGKRLEASADLAGARHAYETASDLDPELIEAREMLVRLAERRTRAAATLEKAGRLEAAKDLPAALKAYESAIDDQPDLIEAKSGLGRIRAALADRRSRAQACLEKGALLESQKDVRGARAAYKTASEIDPDFALAWVRIAHMEPRPKPALAALGRALALDPGILDARVDRERCADFLLDRCRAHLLDDDPEAALADAAEGIASKPRTALLVLFHRLSGEAQESLKRYEAALASFDKAIECFPGAGHLYGLRAGVLADLGRWDDALESAEAGLALEPANGQSLVARARCRAHVRDFDRASLDLDAAEARAGPRMGPLVQAARAEVEAQRKAAAQQ